MAAHVTTRWIAAGFAACALAGIVQAQGVVDRGTGDLGPNSASQRYLEPGNAQFSPETALVDRFGPASPSQLADLYHRGDVSRRYLYQAPGVTAVYNQSDYLTRDALGQVGLNASNGGSSQMVSIAPADIVYVLSPELLQAPTTQVADEVPGQVDTRVRLTPLGSPTPATGVDGRLITQVDGRYDAANPRVVDLAAIQRQMRGPQRDPRLVERSRRWREERERAAAQAERSGQQPAEDEAAAEGPEEAEPAVGPGDDVAAED